MSLNGYARGLVRHFRLTPYPYLVARDLLVQQLAEWRCTGRAYLLELAQRRQEAWINGEDELLHELDAKVYEHALHEQIPSRWKLDFLFSDTGYYLLGEGIFSIWAVALISLSTLERYWRELLQGQRPTDPYRLPGFHRDEELYSTAWLQHFRRLWSTELKIPNRVPSPNIPVRCRPGSSSSEECPMSVLEIELGSTASSGSSPVPVPVAGAS